MLDSLIYWTQPVIEDHEDWCFELLRSANAQPITSRGTPIGVNGARLCLAFR